MIRRRRLLYVMAWLTDFALMLIVFGVSRSLAESGAGLLKMGIAGGGISFFLAISSFFSGYLSDRFGRLTLMLSGVAALLVSASVCSMSTPDRWWYHAAYYLCGASGGLIYPSLIAWLNHGAAVGRGPSGATRTLVMFCVSWNAGLISGQLAGGWLFDHVSTRGPFYLAIALAAATGLLITCIGSAPTRGGAEDPPPEVVRHRALARSFARLCWIANLAGAFSMSMILHLFPDLAASLDIPADTHGAMLAISRGVIICTYLLMHRVRFWHFRFGPALLVQGVAILGLATVTIADAPAPLTLGLAGVAVLVGYNYFASLYYSTAGSSEETRGAASGLHEATLALGFAAGSIAGGIAGTILDPRAPYQLAAIVIALGAAIQIVIYVRAVRPLREREFAGRA